MASFSANRRKEIEQEEPETDNVEPQDKDEEPDEDYFSGSSAEDAPQEDKSTKDVLAKLNTGYANQLGKQDVSKVSVTPKTSKTHNNVEAGPAFFRMTLRIPRKVYREMLSVHAEEVAYAAKKVERAPSFTDTVITLISDSLRK